MTRESTGSEPSDWLPRVGFIALAGIGTGVLTLLGPGVLDAGWNRLANSGAIWLMVGFLVGSRMPSVGWAVAAGVGTLIGAVAGYYMAANLSGTGVSMSAVAIWIGAAIVGGPVYGIAGRWWHDERRSRRAAAIALMGGILSAEARRRCCASRSSRRWAWLRSPPGSC